MTTATASHDTHDAPAPRTGLRRWTGPGWLRVLWVTPIFFALGLGLVVLLRWAAGWQPYWKGTVIITVELVMVPLGFLAGLGGFD